MIPLSRKLYRFRYTLANRQQLIFSKEQMDLVTRHMPMDTEDLRTKCGMIETQIKAYGDQLLGIGLQIAVGLRRRPAEVLFPKTGIAQPHHPWSPPDRASLTINTDMGLLLRPL